MIWSDRDLFGRRRAIAAATKTLEVREISKFDADMAVRKHHYSGSVVWSSNLHLGVFATDELVGVLQFGPAMNPGSGSAIVSEATSETWFELNRMVLTEAAPQFAASQALGCAIRLIKQWLPKIEWIQTFADERCKKLGAVYQAASFLYCGSHIGKFIEIDGEIFHQSMIARPLVDKRGWGCGPKITWVMANKDRAARIEFQQFRYIKTLTRNARLNLLLPILPYPKPAAIRMLAEVPLPGQLEMML